MVDLAADLQHFSHQLFSALFREPVDELGGPPVKGHIVRRLVFQVHHVLEEKVREHTCEIHRITSAYSVYHYIRYKRTCQQKVGGIVEIFAERLKETRMKAKESQKTLGEVLDVTASQIADMESGRRGTTIEKLALICRHYNVSADYLLGLSDLK